MKEVRYYEAFDGTKFEDCLECFKHELNEGPLKPLKDVEYYMVTTSRQQIRYVDFVLWAKKVLNLDKGFPALAFINKVVVHNGDECEAIRVLVREYKLFGFKLLDITEPGTWIWKFDINKNRMAFVKVEESK